MTLLPLRPGDTVQMVTPASPLSEDKLTFATNWLRARGFRTKIAPHALENNGYIAGTDQERADDIQAAFDDEETRAVICSRGGYGCSRLLPYLDFDRIASTRKMLIGFSDVTVLHSALNRRGMPTLHAPMALTLNYPREEWVYESMERMLFGNLVPPPEAPRAITIVGGVAEGKTAGGCLCLLTDSIGTKEQFDPEGKILMLEDVDEQPHRIDAMLTHLLNSGLAAKAAAFVVGEMTRTDEKADKDIGARPWREIITERLAPLGKPMVFGYPFGHMRSMLSVPLGLRARLDADDGTLTFLEPLCG